LGQPVGARPRAREARWAGRLRDDRGRPARLRSRRQRGPGARPRGPAGGPRGKPEASRRDGRSVGEGAVSMPTWVRTRNEDRVGVLAIDRPEASNAIDLQVLCQLEESFLALERRPEVRAVVITGGNEKAF